MDVKYVVLAGIPILSVAVFLWYGYRITQEPPCYITHSGETDEVK